MRAFLWLPVAVVLAGCASPVPTPPPLRGPAPAWQATVPAMPDKAIGNDPLGRTQPLMQELIASAQQASPNLAVAAERLEAARAAATSAGAAMVPLAEATGSATASRSAPNVPVSRRLAVGLQAGWEIDLFGQLAAAQGVARARVEAALSAWHDGRVSLAAEVATAYVALRGCEAQLDLVAVDAASRAETSRLTALSAGAGFLAPSEAALARASAAQARGQLAQTRLACERQIKALVALTDWPEPELRRRLQAAHGQVPVIEPVAVPAVPARLLEQRPDLQEAQFRLRAAAADVSRIERDRLPRLSLSGQIGVGIGLGSRSGGTGTTWSLGPLQLSLPVLEGGIQAANERATMAAYDSARVQLEARVREAVREVEQALLSVQSSSSRLADAREAAEGFDAAQRATQARQRGGLASLFELEDARRQAVAARLSLIDLDQQRATAWIALYRALGGGWAATDAGPSLPTTPVAATASGRP